MIQHSMGWIKSEENYYHSTNDNCPLLPNFPSLLFTPVYHLSFRIVYRIHYIDSPSLVYDRFIWAQCVKTCLCYFLGQLLSRDLSNASRQPYNIYRLQAPTLSIQPPTRCKSLSFEDLSRL